MSFRVSKLFILKIFGKTCLNLGLFFHFSDLFFRPKAKPWPILDHKMITSVFVSLYYCTIDMYLSNKNKLNHNYNCLLIFFLVCAARATAR